MEILKKEGRGRERERIIILTRKINWTDKQSGRKNAPTQSQHKEKGNEGKEREA